MIAQTQALPNAGLLLQTALETGSPRLAKHCAQAHGLCCRLLQLMVEVTSHQGNACMCNRLPTPGGNLATHQRALLLCVRGSVFHARLPLPTALQVMCFGHFSTICTCCSSCLCQIPASLVLTWPAPTTPARSRLLASYMRPNEPPAAGTATVPARPHPGCRAAGLPLPPALTAAARAPAAPRAAPGPQAACGP
jgi:hypothetical protein